MKQRWERFVRSAAVMAGTLAVAIGTVGVAAAEPVDGPLPVPWDLRAGVIAGLNPLQPPPGANDWNCKPSPEHPRPVVLVNPTTTTQALAWQAGSPFLKNNGYCVFTFNFGNITDYAGFPFQALGDISVSAQDLSNTVDQVLAATGAEEVDLVGHSQGGGLLPRYYLKNLGGGDKVHTFVGISPSNHGTSLSEVAFLRSLVPVLGPWVYDTLDAVLPALTQQAIDHPFGTRLDEGGDTVSGVNYYTIVTEWDEVVTPYTRQFLEGPNVTNWVLQDGCDADRSEHISTMYSERSFRYVLNALDPAHATEVPCFPVAPFLPYVQ